MIPKGFCLLFLLLVIIRDCLTLSPFEDPHIAEHIKKRRLREAGFDEFELTAITDKTEGRVNNLDADSIHRRRRSVQSPTKYDMEIGAFGENFKMELLHSSSVLHPSAVIVKVDGDTETEWEGDHPDCFLTGFLHSNHDGAVSASFCDELTGMFATESHEVHFEVLPSHLRKRSTLQRNRATALIARKKQNNDKLASLKQENDYVEETNDVIERKRTRHKRSTAPSGTDITIELAVYLDEDFLQTDMPAITTTSDRITAMLTKYNAVALEWGRVDVLGYNVTIYIKRMTFFDTNPLWYNTSSSLGVPLSNICKGTTSTSYDHIHVHTGVANPSLGGVAYQSTVCNVNYRCGVSADGVTTYVTTAHEIGHNLGMIHDSDAYCLSPDVGIMGGAGVSWSTCSVRDMNDTLQSGNHNCLWEENVPASDITPVDIQGVTLVKELPGQTNTNDEICEKLYGTGFKYREYPQLVQRICAQFSCVNHNIGNTYGQMFKQTASIPGAYCDTNKICFDGSCVDWSAAKLSNLEVRTGGWSAWGSWTSCSRTCGRGMTFRRRKCNNPTPKNSGPCAGNEHDAQCCNLTPCTGDSPTDSVLINQRASETCQYLIDNNIINGSYYTSVGTIYSSFDWGVCEVECAAVDGYTPPSLTRYGLIEQGTPCPGTLDEADENGYSRRPGFYWACLEGYCRKFDCDNSLNLGQFDGCGVCNGNNDTCIIREGTNNDSFASWTRIEWTSIPVGAYNIELRNVWSNNPNYYMEIYTKEDVPIIASSQSGPARIFSTGVNPVNYGGTLFHFHYTTQIMHAEGPITLPLKAKIYRWGATQENNGVSYIYSVPTNIDSCTGTCENGGTWDSAMCACSCPSGYSGLLCASQCTGNTLCKNGASLNESSCECICNEKQYGSLCDCRYPYTGGNCNSCKFYSCQNCGTFNSSTCRCECLPGYGGLQCELECADISDSATCATAAASGNCISDNVNMEQNCIATCNLCVVQSPQSACPVLQCSSSELACQPNQTCISQSKVCDGVRDCSDGSDEPCTWMNSKGSSNYVSYFLLAALFIWLGSGHRRF